MARRHLLILLIPTIWLGFGIRLHQLDNVPFRGDEAFSAQYWAALPLNRSLTEIAPLDPHPPLVYALFRIWGLALGSINSLFALRLLAVLGNILGVPGMFALGRRLTAKPAVGIAAALLWAIHAYEIWHSQDFRNYAIWAGLSATSMALALRLLESPSRRNWICYSAAATASAFLFYTELFTVFSLAVFAILHKRSDRRFLIRFLASQAGIASAVLLTFGLLQGRRIVSGAYPGNVQPFFAPDYLTRLLPTLTIGDTIPPHLNAIWIVLCLALLTLAALVAIRSRRQILFVGATLLVPLIGIGILSQRINLFHPRYILAAVPAVILLVAMGSDAVAERISRALAWSRDLLLLVLLLPWLILHLVTLDAYFNDGAFRKSPAWDELGAFLNQRVGADDLVIQLSADAAFGYYYRGEADDIALPEDPGQPGGDIITVLESMSGQYSSIYVVSNVNPAWPNAQVVESWMNGNLQPVLLSDASGLGIRQFKDWQVSRNFETVLADFGEIIELVDYRFSPEPLPTGELLLWLYWRPSATAEHSLKSFVHVTGALNPASGAYLWTQDDQYPQEGRLDSTGWPLSSVFRDVYYLPANALTAGNYQIIIGWYDPESGRRLQTTNNRDHHVLTSFRYP